MSAKSVKLITVDVIFPLNVRFHLAESELPHTNEKNGYKCYMASL